MTKEFPIKSPRKLIEVALPLDAINEASAKEKGNPFLQGHPRNLHQWWARRPQAAARAVIFSQMVNDPGFQQGSGFRYGLKKSDAVEERKRLFDILKELILWNNTTNEDVLERARNEIRRSWEEVCDLNKEHPNASELFDRENIPDLHDPFAGGGAIPLAAQRLGLGALASDLNPVAVVINKSLIEVAPRFRRFPPVKPKNSGEQKLLEREEWYGNQGLATDLRYYASLLRKEAEKLLGHLYPKVVVSEEIARGREDLERYKGQRLDVRAWIWARTVASSNPAFSHVHVPLASSFVLSRKKGKEVYLEPVVEGATYTFSVRRGKPPVTAKTGTKISRGANFRCILSGDAIEPAYIKAEGMAGRMKQRLIAIVGEGHRERVFLDPTVEMAEAAYFATPDREVDTALPNDVRNFWTQNYGLAKFGDLFTDRQLTTIRSLCDLVPLIREQCKKDAILAGMEDDGVGLDSGGNGAMAYADGIACFLSLAVDKFADYNNSLCTWNPTNQNIGHLFTKQSIPMAWDFPEVSPLSGGLAVDSISEGIAKAIELLPDTAVSGKAFQSDCCAITSKNVVFSTDPPYYDNIGYADLSDFFYVLLRRSLRTIFPSLFSTIATPKDDELIAASYRHGNKVKAESFFTNGMGTAMSRLAECSHPAFPVCIYYAFKQSETKEGSTSSTGWVTFLEAVINSGFTLVGTWPMRTERKERSVAKGTNALASSIVLVCRKRRSDAASVSRRAYIRELNQVLPEALDEMTRGIGEEQSPVAPVDLSQAIIGPGMAVFSKYAAVLEADGSPMTVRTALELINRFLAEDDFDADTQFCLHWFEQYGWSEKAFGEADVLARAKSTSVSGLADAGVLKSGGGRVQLLKWSDYPADWNPQKDSRIPIWEVLHQLIRALKQGGESSAGELLGQPNVQSRAEAARQLAYRLYTLCERKGWPEDARAYNEIITSWSAIELSTRQTIQSELF